MSYDVMVREMPPDKVTKAAGAHARRAHRRRKDRNQRGYGASAGPSAGDQPRVLAQFADALRSLARDGGAGGAARGGAESARGVTSLLYIYIMSNTARKLQKKA